MRRASRPRGALLGAQAVSAWLLLSMGFVLSGIAGAAPREYVLTPTHSFVHFEWRHLGLSTVSGRFDRVGGRIMLDRTSKTASGEIRLQLDSLNTGLPARDQALRAALQQVFGAAEARWQLQSMRFDGDRPAFAAGRLDLGARSLSIDGLTVHFNCYLNPLLRREVCGGDFEAEIDPRAIGPALAASAASFGLDGPLRLRVQVEALHQVPE